MAEHNITNKSKKYRNIFIAVSFLLVFGIVLYTTFFGTPNISSNAIFGSGNATEVLGKGIKISADLTIPELSTRGKYNEIALTAQPPSSFYASDQRIEIPGTKQSDILLRNYDGKISLNKNSLEIDGKTEKIFTENIPISSKSRDYTKVEIGEEFDYINMEIKNDFNIKSLEYITSGTINVDQGTSISLNNEKIKLEGFIGTIAISNGRMTLDGKLSSISVEGEKKISISN